LLAADRRDGGMEGQQSRELSLAELPQAT